MIAMYILGGLYNIIVMYILFDPLVWEMLAYRRVFEGIGAREFYQQARHDLFLHPQFLAC
jgi:hypothetical protein